MDFMEILVFGDVGVKSSTIHFLWKLRIQDY